MAALLVSLLLVASETVASQAPSNGSLSGEHPIGCFTISGGKLLLRGGVFATGWAREHLLVPVLRVAIAVSMVVLAMMLAEKTFLAIIRLYVKLFRRKAEKIYEWKPIADNGDSSVFPTVLVQIPMYNEKEVYKLSIGAACRLSWPRDRFVVQVLDDSTDPEVKEMVMAECREWAAKGINIKYQVRADRRGYKAGALREGMKHAYVEHCEYVAIFDADFQPEPDFLRRTVPFLVYNSRLALVQSRWIFVNAGASMLTRIQEMSLNYHFKVEQQGGSSSAAFFGYNGTAGVWRISAINDAGGWYDRTTVEDMDLAVRAGVKGWKFVYAGDIKVKSELPSSFNAYRFQQHRWTCGPANLLRKIAVEIIVDKSVSAWKKLYLVVYFMFFSRVLVHAQAFFYFCTAIPLVVFAPEVDIPSWGLIYAPVAMTIFKAVETPRSLHLTPFWVLFENAMTLHRIKAVAIGLLGGGRANEWVVTEKLGGALKAEASGQDLEMAKISSEELRAAAVSGQGLEMAEISVEELQEPLLPVTAKPCKKEIKNRFRDRLNFPELIWGVLLVCCGFYDLLVSSRGLSAYALLQGLAFFVEGFGYVGSRGGGTATKVDYELKMTTVTGHDVVHVGAGAASNL